MNSTPKSVLRRRARLMTRREVSEEKNIPHRFLEQAAVTGDGPPFVKVSHRIVRYYEDDVDEWLNARRVASTAEVAA
ncbi:MAG: AlpA family transcriptional regulator [Pseudomonadota bacterium]